MIYQRNKKVKHYLFFIFSFFLTFSAYGQKLFPSDSSTWVVSDIQNYHCTPSNVGSLKYAWSGDTIINSIRYERIIRTTNFSNPSCYFSPFPETRIFYRQVGQRLYAYDPFNLQDTLLYDFSLNVGDTLKSALSSACPLEITSVDSILLQSGYHKKISFLGQGCSNGFMIEGIGSSFGLFEKLVSFESNSTLECFSTIGTNYPSGTSMCSFITGIESAINEKRSLCYLIRGEEFIRFEKSSDENFVFFDSVGKHILSGIIQNNRISVVNLIPGIYYGKVVGSEGFYTIKLIKLN